MIAYLEELPLIRFPDGRVWRYESSWLTESLALAAETVGQESWLAPHVAQGVEAYLRRDVQEDILPLADLEAIVRRALCAVGFPEIANAYESIPPPTRFSLLDLALAAGSGFELLFFQILSRRLQEAVEAGSRRIACEDLRDCVKVLRGAKHWRSDCRGLHEEIIDFVRERLEKSPSSGTTVALQLS
jgi:hypothetical protein